MDKLSKVTSTIYSAFLILGGIMGYVKAQSKMSLLTGLVSGLIVLLALKVSEKNPKAGYLFIASISLVIAIFFSLRFAASHAFMPSGLMLILSTITYVFVARGWIKG